MPDGQGGNSLVEAINSLGERLGVLWLLILALWGGTVSYLSKIKKQGTRFRIVELFAQWLTSGFAGLITAYICASMGLSFVMTAIFTGMAGHMGAGALVLIERWTTSKLSHVDTRNRRDE